MSNDGPGVFDNLIGYVGYLFMAQLSASVVNTMTNWLSLCNTMNPSLANIFFGPANRVVGTTCNHVGLSDASDPDFGASNPPARAADVIHKAATLLLAWQGLSFFKDPGQLQWACDEFMGGSYDILPNVAALDLNATLFRNSVCQFVEKDLPSLDSIRKKLDQHTAEIFAETLWSVGNSGQHRQLLCKGYKNGRLENLAARQYFGQEPRRTLEEKIIAHCEEAAV